MNNIKEQIENAKNKIEEVTELFYQQKTADAYDQLEIVLTLITQIVDMIYDMDINPDIREENTKVLMGALQETLQAMEDKDSVLVADILKYEVEEKLEILVAEIDR